jgi:hypothetical protein
VRPRQKPQGLVQLTNCADHGKQHLKVTQTGIGAQHDAQLHQEELRLIQREAYAATSEKRVVFLERKRRQGLVAAYVKGA